MFYSVRGKLIHKAQNFVVIECGGVGYRCYTSSATQNKLPDINSQTTLYTHLVVREDAMELYGFSTLNELECFDLPLASGDPLICIFKPLNALKCLLP